MNTTAQPVPGPSDLSLVITAHKDGPMLRACFRAVSRLDPAPLEVIVAVDGNGAEFMDLCLGYGFRVITLPGAPGVSATRNAGATRAKGRFLAFVDSDVEVRSDFVTQAFAALKRHPNTRAAFGSYDDRPAAPGLVSRYRNLLHHFTHQTARREAQTFWAACGVCEAEVFHEAGGYDELIRKPSVEDIELGYRIRAAGHRIVLDPGWQIRHLKKWTLKDLITTDVFRRAVPWTLLLLRERRFDNNLNLDRRSRLSAMLCASGVLGLAFSPFQPVTLLPVVSAFAWLFYLNRRFYFFLAGRGGGAFALSSMALHLLYYLAAVSGYAIGRLIFQWESFCAFGGRVFGAARKA